MDCETQLRSVPVPVSASDVTLMTLYNLPAVCVGVAVAGTEVLVAVGGTGVLVAVLVAVGGTTVAVNVGVGVNVLVGVAVGCTGIGV